MLRRQRMMRHAISNSAAIQREMRETSWRRLPSKAQFTSIWKFHYKNLSMV
jgi:hypothetical protein